MTRKREAEELLLIEEADAWFEYLEVTRAQSAVRYREVEPWAWARLQQRMRAIKARRAKLRPRGGLVAAWSADFEPAPGFQPPKSGFADRARARIRDSAFYSPPRYRNEIEQLAGDRPQAEAGSERRRDLGQPLARVDREPVGLLEPQDEPDLVDARAPAGRRRG